MSLKFGDNVKRLRIDKKISQLEFTKMIGMHATHLSRYERSLIVPSIDTAKKMAVALGASIDELVFGKELDIDRVICDKELIGLFNEIQTFSNKQKNTVKDFLSAFVRKNTAQQ